ncbi:MAG: hypothetical protein REI96_06370 [Flavobacterium nitrogenifigens]|uniref:hypothetical protein n=1 Tax=Flavobacterium nitrogenifigens TaxID=1617283 RepID=UPI0028072340|nr:hypothetical protein [Flavobacterium nitrogenifigens]MDQ8012052.1 hypothetical protein [Flavobacterium nitrogenifigens]
MNKTIFNQTGGFPLKTERLQELQTAFEIFNSLGNLAGNFTIISGCETVGTKVQDGFIFINGEIIEFREAVGDNTSTVIIIEEEVNRSFENGTVKPVYLISYATFGTAETSWPWSSFTRPMQTKSIAGVLQSKEDKSTVTSLATRVQNLENALAAMTIPQIQVTSGNEPLANRVGGDGSTNWTRNYVYVYPPAGYTMAHLRGFVPSISVIRFSGDVNSDDTLWCKWTSDASKVTVICGNSELRDTAYVNYLAVWIK